MTDDNSENSRRAFLRGAGIVGGVSLFPRVTAAQDTTAKDDPPTPYPEQNNNGVSRFRHLTEFPSVGRQIRQFESTGDPEHLYTTELTRRLEESSESTVDVVVSTMGTKRQMTRDRDGQTLRGFRPTDGEANALSSFGTVTYVADIVSTKVCVRDVDRSDLPELARLPFVVEIAPMVKDISLNSVPIEDVVTDSWSHFDSAHGNYSIDDISMAIMEGGYDDSYNPYASNYAQDIGFDTSLSKDFTVENDPFSSTDDHAVKVADTAGYVLKDGNTHSDLFVALKVYESYTENYDENIRQGIEYATTEGIEVLNMSFGTVDAYSECPSTFCSELDSYVSGGGIPVAAVDNNKENTETCHPACSWVNIGVGATEKKDANDNAVLKTNENGPERDSQYGTIFFHSQLKVETYCSWCYNRSGRDVSFAPDSYAAGVINTDNNNKIRGTSFACPQVAASALIDYADGGITSYADTLNKFTNMNAVTVVDKNSSKDPSRDGEVMRADYYF